MQHFPRAISGLYFIELAQTSKNFRQEPLKAHLSFGNPISLHPVYVCSPVRYTDSASFSVLLTSWSAVCKRSVSLQFCDQIQSSMHHIFTQMHSTVSIGDHHTWNVPRNLHTSPHPHPRQKLFSHFWLYNFIILSSPHFFFIRTLLPIFLMTKRQTKFQ